MTLVTRIETPHLEKVSLEDKKVILRPIRGLTRGAWFSLKPGEEREFWTAFPAGIIANTIQYPDVNKSVKYNKELFVEVEEIEVSPFLTSPIYYCKVRNEASELRWVYAPTRDTGESELKTMMAHMWSISLDRFNSLISGEVFAVGINTGVPTKSLSGSVLGVFRVYGAVRDYTSPKLSLMFDNPYAGLGHVDPELSFISRAITGKRLLASGTKNTVRFTYPGPVYMNW